MKYGDILGRAFRALKSGTLWLYAVTATFAVAAPFVLIGLVWFAAFRGRTFGLPVGGVEGELLATFAGFAAVFMLGGLLCLPILLIVRGGYVHLTDSIIAGVPVSLGDAWSFGARRIGRTFGIEAVLFLIAWAVAFVLTLPFAAIVILVSVGSRGNAGSAIAGICFGYVYLFVVVILMMLVWVGIEQVAVRYGLIGGRTFGDAISSAWQAFKAMKGRFVVFTLIMIGLQYGYSMLTSIITTPLTFALMPSWYWQSMINPSASPNPAEVLASMNQMFGRMALIYPVTIALTVPFMVFAHSAWTAFFRQLTGLDVPPPTPVRAYGYPPGQSYPASPGYPPPQGYGYPSAPQYPPPQEYPPTAPPDAPPIAGYAPAAEGYSPPAAGWAPSVEAAPAPAAPSPPADAALPDDTPPAGDGSPA